MKIKLTLSKINPYKIIRNTGIATLITAGSIVGANISTKDEHKENFIPTAQTAGAIATLGLGATVAGVVGQKQKRKNELNKTLETPIKELSDEEFENMQKTILKKREKLNYYNNTIIDTSFNINKYNIQILNKVIESNEDFRMYYDTLRNIDDIYSAKFFNYLYTNKNKIPKDVLNLLYYKEPIENEIELNTKINLVNEGMNNPQMANNSFLKEIIKYSKNEEDAKYLKYYTHKYGITPAYKMELLTKFDENTLNKILDQINDIRKKYNLNLDHLQQTSYANNTDLIYFTTRNQLDFLFDKNGDLLSFEKDNTIHNLKNNTSFEVKPKEIKIYKDDPFESRILHSADLEITNSNDEIVKRNFYRSKIKGEFEQEEIDLNNKYKTALAEFDKKGGKHIEKHLTSLDGTTTDYVYASDKKGNYYFYQKITDKNNKVLFENQKKFKVLGDNHFLSTTNCIKYDIRFEPEKIVIKNLKTNQQIKYKIKKYTDDDYQNIKIDISLSLRDKDIKPQLEKRTLFLGDIFAERGLIEKYTVDKKLVKNLKQISGDEWFNMYKANVLALISTNEPETAQSIGRLIEISKDNSYLGVIEHELGHEKDNYLKLWKDEKLKKIYTEEKLQLTTNLPNLIVEQPSYFLQSCVKGRSESVAEANLIINAMQDWENAGSRTFFFQQYFPRTIAYIGNKFKEISEN